MNWRSIYNLIYLRYKLMWAKTRSRTGKIALFLIGLLSYQLLLALVSAGGIGAAVLAVRSGKAEEMAQIFLSGLFLNAVFGSVLLGFGMSAAFTDAELKRYPLNRIERFTVRHIIGVVDPFWLLFLAIGSGLVVGLSIWGSYSLVSGSVALFVLLLHVLIDPCLEHLDGSTTGGEIGIRGCFCTDDADRIRAGDGLSQLSNQPCFFSKDSSSITIHSTVRRGDCHRSSGQ